MWQCPACAEQHKETFDICWKCGMNRDGVRDPNFHILEPVRLEDQLLAETDNTKLPVLRLPTFTYFSIPPYIWLCLAMFPYHSPFTEGSFWPGGWLLPAWIAVQVLGALLIGIPCFAEMVRGFYHLLVKKKFGKNDFTELFWMLSIFRLPKPLQLQRRWFSPIYYGSIIAFVIVSIGVSVWSFSPKI